MKWLRLKLQMVPIIAVEINNAIAEYHSLVTKIQELSRDGTMSQCEDEHQTTLQLLLL